jgi:hypothetical protein
MSATAQQYKAHHCTNKAAVVLEECSLRADDPPMVSVLLAVADGWMALAELISRLPEPEQQESTP